MTGEGRMRVRGCRWLQVQHLRAVAGAAVAQDFRALARQDLQRSHDELAANHPAPAVPGAASQVFRGWMLLSLPQLALVEHPTHDIRLAACKP